MATESVAQRRCHQHEERLGEDDSIGELHHHPRPYVTDLAVVALNSSNTSSLFSRLIRSSLNPFNSPVSDVEVIFPAGSLVQAFGNHPSVFQIDCDSARDHADAEQHRQRRDHGHVEQRQIRPLWRTGGAEQRPSRLRYGRCFTGNSGVNIPFTNRFERGQVGGVSCRVSWTGRFPIVSSAYLCGSVRM